MIEHSEAYNIQCLIGATEYDNLKESGVLTDFNEFKGAIIILNDFNKQVAEDI